jgi:hypothetical protein
VQDMGMGLVNKDEVEVDKVVVDKLLSSSLD